ncbi:MAG: hypothetical protein WCO44_05835 [Bacteroidota bacterium]
MSAAPDRIKKMLTQDQVTGIDFIYVYPDQLELDVYFLPTLSGIPTLFPGSAGPLAANQIKIYNPEAALPEIEILDPVSWIPVDGRDVLHLKTSQRGDFTRYRLRIDDARIDSWFNDVSFSFKANCPGDLDCKTGDPDCPADELVDFPVDYQARDFWSFRRALLDFAALRYPDWPDRLEADAGVMMAELMSALGDEMSYYQDRVSREAYLETATQRRSIRRHARLVDYQMHDGLGAKGWLDLTVDKSAIGFITVDAGEAVFAQSDDGTQIFFETSEGLADYYDPLNKRQFYVKALLNQLDPHIWDRNNLCLPAGTTEIFIDGHYTADLTAHGLPKWILLQTSPPDPAQPVRKQLVNVTEVSDTRDYVLGKDITRIAWKKEQALLFEFDLTVLQIRCNIVPVTAGKTFTAFFIVNHALSALSDLQREKFGDSPAGETVNRTGHDGTECNLYTLPGSGSLPLVYLGDDPHQFNTPEIILEEVEFNSGSKTWDPKAISGDWEYRPALVGIHSSNPTDRHYTFDDGTWQRVVGYQRIGKVTEHRDYAMNGGVTLRFGDNEFGRAPEPGSVFRVRYRLGGGSRSNVADNTIQSPLPGMSITNPLAATGGWDAETPEELRQLAPEAFRAITYRAVRPEDYAEAAERLPWVQKAGAAFRWTGSWLTLFATPDPLGKVTLDPPDRKDLSNQLDRFRQAGREVAVMDPRYASLDLVIDICVSPEAYPGQVKERVMQALTGAKGLRDGSAYFSPDRFTFGTCLERSTLEAAIQEVKGVNAVEKITFRRKGWFGWRIFREMNFNPGRDTIIRVANDPLHPERGSLKIHTHGGL